MENKYLEEILEQPEVLHLTTANYPIHNSLLSSLNSRILTGEIENVILTGMGASLASCYPLMLSLSKHGINATIWDTSELVYYGSNILSSKTLLIVVSQSGESAEIRNLVNQKRPIGFLIAITNNPDSTLGKKADVCINLHAGEEETVSTKTYLASIAALHLLCTQLLSADVEKQKETLHSLADTAKEYMNQLQENIDEATSFLGNTNQLVVLGRGYSLASVQTASLILKEASKIFSFGLSTAQFRHGPMEIVRPGLKAILFIGSQSTQDINQNFASELSEKSGLVTVISQYPWESESKNIYSLPIPSVDERLLPILEIIPVQFLTIPLAANLGFVAGEFINCEKITLKE